MQHYRQGYEKIDKILCRGLNCVAVNIWTHEDTEQGWQTYCTELIYLDKNAGILSGTRIYIHDDNTECIYSHPENLVSV